MHKYAKFEHINRAVFTQTKTRPAEMMLGDALSPVGIPVAGQCKHK